MSGAMLLYRNLEILSRDKHQRLKLRPVERYTFAAGMHWIPVIGAEFFRAALNYPIMFVAENSGGQDTVTPILLLGLSAGKNDYLTPDNRWRPNTYIPAFIRRYPFIFSHISEGADDLALCIDAGFEGLNELTGTPLFNGDGTNSQFLQEIVNFLNALNNEQNFTRDFVNLLLKYDLLVDRVIDITSSSGIVFQLPGFNVIDLERFMTLGQAELAEFSQRGFLGWIFAHDMSLANLSSLLDMHLTEKTPAAS